MYQHNILNDERPAIQKKIASVEKDLKRVDDEIKAEWDTIKDFTVSANRADDGYRRIAKLRSLLKKLNTDKRKLEKKLLDLNTASYAKD